MTSKPSSFSLWGFLRNVLNQGMAIQMDATAPNRYPTYEHLSARLDEAAREREAELERQWVPSDLQTDRDCLVLVLGRLVRKMEECHADEAFKSVWMINQLHTGPYTGPKYEEEFLNAQAYLKHRIDSHASPAETGVNPCDHMFVIDSEKRPGETFCLKCNAPEIEIKTGRSSENY